MSEYTMAFDLGGRTRQVTWKDGELSGDSTAVRELTRAAKIWEGFEVGPPTGPYTTKNHLADPLSAFFLAQEFFGAVEGVSGDLPTAPRITEKGAIP